MRWRSKIFDVNFFALFTKFSSFFAKQAFFSPGLLFRFFVLSDTGDTRLELPIFYADSSLARVRKEQTTMQVVALARSAAAASPAKTTRGPAAPAAAAGAAPSQNIRIKLKSFDTRAIVEAGEAIIGAAASTGATVSGPVPLPTR